MKSLVMTGGALLVIGLVVFYAARFVAAYRGVKRDVEGIRRSGHTKRAMRSMRRQIHGSRAPRK
jgi:hypothetical protein